MSCPICGKPTVQDYRPFCSKRCADVDLARWLNESYTLPAEDAQRTREVAVVGADRHGLDVLVTVGSGTTTLRASFAEPVREPRDVVRALCGVFGCPCHATGTEDH